MLLLKGQYLVRGMYFGTALRYIRFARPRCTRRASMVVMTKKKVILFYTYFAHRTLALGNPVTISAHAVRTHITCPSPKSLLYDVD